METNINIAKILKNVPIGTRLYSPLFGDVFLKYIGVMFITVRHHGTTANFHHNGRLYDYEGTEPMLFPSKEMRDWSKVTWKKGDVLVSNDGSTEVIFDGWYDDTYTNFYGKRHLDSENENNIKYFEGFVCTTDRYFLESKDAAQTYINTIEERLDGTLNRETLEIEKTQPEFKDGDIAFADFGKTQDVFIVSGKTNLSEGYYSFIALNLNSTKALSIGCKISFFKKNLNTLRLATDSEKQQLFDALAKEGKQWDAEKKQIVDLKPNVDELKPFDKVLVRDSKSDNWRANLFGYIGKDGYYRCVYANWVYCIPYAGNEHLLGTTKDVED